MYSLKPRRIIVLPFLLILFVCGFTSASRAQEGDANPPSARIIRMASIFDAMADHLAKEKACFLSELETLERHVQHVRDIIHLQQDYSRIRGVTEPVHIQQVIEDALELIAESNAKNGIIVQKAFEALPECWMDRHKLLQILINLISNARDAVMSEKSGPKIIRITLKHSQPDRARIEVSDNGAGISAENLTRIFQHGFTTRADGHGFGLHSSAIAAGELSGSIKAESQGIGKAATFVVDLPFRPKENSHGSD